MKRILFFLVTASLLYPSTILAQEEPLPTPLPIVIIQGEDRSYMEIIRTKKLSYMGLRGEKSKERLLLEIVLFPLVRHTVFFPPFTAKPIEVAPVGKKKEISPSPAPKDGLSQSYIRYGGGEMRPERKGEVFLKQSIGEKRLVQPPLRIELPGKEAYSPPSFPSLTVKPVKVVAPVGKKKEISPSPAPKDGLSQSYIRYGGGEMRPERKGEVFLKQSIGEKRLVPSPLRIELPGKEAYSPLSFPSLTVKPVKVVAPVGKKKEISPSPAPKDGLSQSYIRYGGGEMRPERKGEVFLKQSIGEKKLIQPPEEVAFLPQRSFPVAFPRREIKPLKVVSIPSKKEIPLSAFKIAFSPSISFQPPFPRREMGPSKERPVFMLKERKGVIQPPLETSLAEKVYYPEQIEKSPLPYFYLSSSLGSYDNFNYGVNYGRELNTTKYLLAVERNSSPLWSIYEEAGLSQNLYKEDDKVGLTISWNNPGESGWGLVAEAYQEKLEFPDKKREQTKVFFQPMLELTREKNIFRLNGWIETVGGLDQPATGATTRWEDMTFGAQIEMQMRESPISLGIRGDWESLKGDYNRQENQAYLWGKHRSLLSGKNIVVSLEGGIKGIKGEKAEFVPSLKVDYFLRPSWRINLGVVKKFYLPYFSWLYLNRDYGYVGINENLDAVNLWDYRLRLESQNLPKVDIALEVFYSNGRGVVWDWDGDENTPENVKLSRQGWKLEFTYHSSPSFRQELTFISQNAENIDPAHPGWVITYSPRNSGQLWLKWEEEGWVVAVGGEWIGKRYYDLEDSSKELPPGWRGRLKVSRKTGNWKIFAELELNDYCLWGLGGGKYYKLPKQKVNAGVEIKLF